MHPPPVHQHIHFEDSGNRYLEKSFRGIAADGIANGANADIAGDGQRVSGRNPGRVDERAAGRMMQVDQIEPALECFNARQHIQCLRRQFRVILQYDRGLDTLIQHSLPGATVTHQTAQRAIGQRRACVKPAPVGKQPLSLIDRNIPSQNAVDETEFQPQSGHAFRHRGATTLGGLQGNHINRQHNGTRHKQSQPVPQSYSALPVQVE